MCAPVPDEKDRKCDTPKKSKGNLNVVKGSWCVTVAFAKG